MEDVENKLTMEMVVNLENRILNNKVKQQDRIIKKLEDKLADTELELDIARIKINKMLLEVTNDKPRKKKNKRKNVKYRNRK